ncbi:PAS domain S-box protein, partial [Fulvivirga kasyanovii]
MEMLTTLQSYVDAGGFYKDAVEDGSDIIFVVDLQGKILYHNSAEETLGYGPNALQERNFLDFIAPQKRNTIQSVFRNCLTRLYT